MMEEEKNTEERLEVVLVNFIVGSKEIIIQKDFGCYATIAIFRWDFMGIAPINLTKNLKRKRYEFCCFV